jgi:hypothetical protein
LSEDVHQITVRYNRKNGIEERELRRTQSNSTIELTGGIHQVKIRFTVVGLSGLVDVGLGEEEKIRARFVPLHLNLVGFVESFRAGRRGESEEGVNFDGSGCAL